VAATHAHGGRRRAGVARTTCLSATLRSSCRVRTNQPFRARLDTALTALLVICALGSTGTLAYREVSVSRRGPNAQDVTISTEQWRAVLALDSTRSVTGPVFVVFADLECPACRAFANVLAETRAKYEPRVQFRVHHYPLPYHKMATAAAEAAECARVQDRFWPFHDAVYRMQDSLGLKPFDTFAAEAGVADLSRFEQCVRSRAFKEVVSRDLALARQLALPGTPAIIFEGKYVEGADASTLSRLIDTRLAGTR
jgi:protein-disulfide isomerase